MNDFVILLVEDNLGDQQLIRKALHSKGRETILKICNNADEAFIYLQANLPHLIIMDLNLPGKSGFEILVEIKQDNVLATIPTIIFSSAKDITNKDISEPDAYIVKPSELKEYFDIILAMDQFGRNMKNAPEKRNKHLKLLYGRD